MRTIHGIFLEKSATEPKWSSGYYKNVTSYPHPSGMAVSLSSQLSDVRRHGDVRRQGNVRCYGNSHHGRTVFDGRHSKELENLYLATD